MVSIKPILKNDLIFGIVLFLLGSAGIIYGVFSLYYDNFWFFGNYIVVFIGSILTFISFLVFPTIIIKWLKYYRNLNWDDYNKEEKLNLKFSKRREKQKTMIISFSLIVLVVLASITGFYVPKIRNFFHVYSLGEIVIQKDNDFTVRYSFPGSGTKDDPYRIEDLTIATDKNYGIYITKTSSYFIIRNCIISALLNSIVIRNVAYGTCSISDNTCHYHSIFKDQLYNGIYLYNSPGSTITGNELIGFSQTKNRSGIHIFYSSYTIITSNYCENFKKGIICDGLSNNVVIAENICSFCIYGIIISGNDVYYYDSSSDEFYYVSILLKNLLIINNTCSNCIWGIFLDKDILSTYVLYNKCLYNENAGIWMFNISNITIANNFCYKNEDGIILLMAIYSSIIFNELSFNSICGITLVESVENEIHHNNFINNTIQASDNNVGDLYGGLNVWYNSLSIEGNFWSDLIWNEFVIYEIDGGNNTDPYPLEQPVEIYF